jgi:hypothetical protein
MRMIELDGLAGELGWEQRRGGEERGEGVGGGGGDGEVGEVGGADELLRAGVVEEGDEAVEVVGGVEQGAGLVVEAELSPGEDLKELVEGAHPAGEGDEGVGEVVHHRFAVVHGGDDVEASEGEVVDLAGEQGVGDDAKGLAAVVEDGVGEGTHEADGGAPVNERDAMRREQGAEGDGVFAEAGVCAGLRAAEDADALDRGERRLGHAARRGLGGLMRGRERRGGRRSRGGR